MAKHAHRETPRVIACTASAGGFSVLLDVLRALPDGFAVPVVVVMHVRREEPSTLPDVLARATKRTVRSARDGDALEPGIVYVAPPGWHLVIRRGGRGDERGAPFGEREARGDQRRSADAERRAQPQQRAPERHPAQHPGRRRRGGPRARRAALERARRGSVGAPA